MAGSSTHPKVELDTIESLTAHYSGLRKRWLQSACRAQIMDSLRHHKPADGGWSVKKAVAIGLGKMTDEWGPNRVVPMMQSVVFLDIANHIKANSESNIELYSQEYRMPELDRQFLRSLQVRVLDDPAAQDMCGPGVFAMAPRCPIDVEIIAQCEDLWPDLFFGNTLNPFFRREEHHIDTSRQIIDESTSVNFKRLQEDRIAGSQQRMQFLRAFQVSHDEVKIANLLNVRTPDDHPKMNHQPLHRQRLYFRKDTEAPKGKTQSTDEDITQPPSCDFCKAGARFKYRDSIEDSLNDCTSSAWAGEEEIQWYKKRELEWEKEHGSEQDFPPCWEALLDEPDPRIREDNARDEIDSDEYMDEAEAEEYLRMMEIADSSEPE